ncbi:hypothetical protein WA026_000941 [Henosepilachna vigintioctopunctata]|uniref:THAP-type domain-containing protein n=1 Tax=Henosepilachna vigintioctopunctata TaxID=420089 RepID=A0AAW1V0X3_9CUCU
MGMCFVPDCKHYSQKHTCSFFRFPKNKTEKNRWISFIRREDREPSQFSKVCDCHFVNREKKNGPTLFEFNAKKRSNFECSPRRRRASKDDLNNGCAMLSTKTEIIPQGQTFQPQVVSYNKCKFPVLYNVKQSCQ